MEILKIFLKCLKNIFKQFIFILLIYLLSYFVSFTLIVTLRQRISCYRIRHVALIGSISVVQ
jgi:uncharacterized membrane protein YccF (DUF307 family)